MKDKEFDDETVEAIKNDLLNMAQSLADDEKTEDTQLILRTLRYIKHLESEG